MCAFPVDDDLERGEEMGEYYVGIWKASHGFLARLSTEERFSFGLMIGGDIGMMIVALWFFLPLNAIDTSRFALPQAALFVAFLGAYIWGCARTQKRASKKRSRKEQALEEVHEYFAEEQMIGIDIHSLYRCVKEFICKREAARKKFTDRSFAFLMTGIVVLCLQVAISGIGENPGVAALAVCIALAATGLFLASGSIWDFLDSSNAASLKSAVSLQSSLEFYLAYKNDTASGFQSPIDSCE